jgi:hypothetical protein
VYHQQEEAALQVEQDEADFASSVATRGGHMSGGGYVSPFQDLFDRMHENGPTSLGTTEEIVRFEREFEKNQKYLQCGIPEKVLRFTTTCYGRTKAAPHVMVNEHKVTVCVNTKYLPLDDTEKEILREIVGKRLNDERRELRLQSNQFGSRIENKRHVVSMLDRILLACQRLGREIRGEAATAAAETSASTESRTTTTSDHTEETAMELRDVVEETSGSNDKIEGSAAKNVVDDDDEGEEVDYGAEQELHDLMAGAESVEIQEIPIVGETHDFVEPLEAAAAADADGTNMKPSTSDYLEEALRASEAISEDTTAASAVPDEALQKIESVHEEMEMHGTVESQESLEQYSASGTVEDITESSVESFELHSELDATSEETASRTDEEQLLSSQNQPLTTEASDGLDSEPVIVAEDNSAASETTFVSADVEEMVAAAPDDFQRGVVAEDNIAAAKEMAAAAPDDFQTGVAAEDNIAAAETTFVSTDVEEMVAAAPDEQQPEESQHVSMESSDTSASIEPDTTNSSLDSAAQEEVKDALDGTERDNQESSTLNESKSPEETGVDEDGKKD